MKSYTFCEGVPGDLRPGFEVTLYNLPEYISLWNATGWLSYHALDQGGNTVALMHVHTEGGIARSPYRAPFGSLEDDGKTAPEVLYEFLEFVRASLKKKGVRELLIKNPPRSYGDGRIALLETFLLNQGFVVTEAETGACIRPDDRPFEFWIRHSELLRHRQAHVTLTVARLAETDLDSVHDAIAAWHRDKGYRLSATRDDLRMLVEKFPGRYVFFGVFKHDTLVGASVSVRVKKQVLYNFLLNHDPRYNTLSPPLLLVESIYNYCRDNRITLLDLGTSALNGVPNFPLLDFKIHLGGEITSKLTFKKIL